MKQQWEWVKRYVAFVSTSTLFVGGIALTFWAQTAYAAAPPSVLINEIKISGKATDATKGFVELYNPLSSSVDITNWSLQAYNQNGASASDPIFTFPSGAHIGPHGYLLLAYPGGSNLPVAADYEYSGADFVNNMGLGLLDAQKNPIDFVRWGTARLPNGMVTQGLPALNPPAGTSLSRNSQHSNTQNNLADFTLLSSPTPTSSQATILVGLTASIVYSQGGEAKNTLNLGPITVEVTISGLSQANNEPVYLTLTRPSGKSIIVPLRYDAATQKWLGTFNTNELGVISQNELITARVDVVDSNAQYTITSGGSFTLLASLAPPVVQIKSQCPGTQDSFVATTSNPDIDKIYVYKSSDLSPSNLLAVAPVVNNSTGSVYIGDNAVETVYVVAYDIYGHRSDAVSVVNRITPPASPDFQLNRQDGGITVSWQPVIDASKYIVRWRPTDIATWDQQEVTTSSFKLAVDNSKLYEISLASVDAACNQSAFTTQSSSPYQPTAASVVPASANSSSTAAKENAIFKAALAKTGEKDGMLSVATGQEGGAGGNKNATGTGGTAAGGGAKHRKTIKKAKKLLLIQARYQRRQSLFPLTQVQSRNSKV